MKKYIQRIFVILFFVLISSSVFCQKRYHSIFNGKNLSGWKIFGTEKWYVDKGDLVCQSGPERKYGYLGTTRQYKDFELTIDFKQQANGNSGVFFHSSIDGTTISGWQAEVAPPGLHTAGIYESYGRGWLIQPDSAKEKILNLGKWNTMKIRVQGGHVTTWLNGVQMIDLNDEKIGSRTGSIALQIHEGGGIKVRFRKIKIREI